LSIESKIKEISKRYGHVTIYSNENGFKLSTGNYDPEETYTYNYETEYYSSLIGALNAYLIGKVK